MQRYPQAIAAAPFAQGMGYDFPELREALNKVKR